MSLSYLDVKVNAFIDMEGKRWDRVRLREVSYSTDGPEIPGAYVSAGWQCEDGRLYAGQSLYSGGETGAGISGQEAPTKDNPKVYGEGSAGRYVRWYEIVP